MSSIETPFWKLYSGIRAVTKSPIVSFVSLWDSINAKKEGCSWKDNPYIWMPKFKVLSTTLEETQKLIEGMDLIKGHCFDKSGHDMGDPSDMLL